LLKPKLNTRKREKDYSIQNTTMKKIRQVKETWGNSPTINAGNNKIKQISAHPNRRLGYMYYLKPKLPL